MVFSWLESNFKLHNLVKSVSRLGPQVANWLELARLVGTFRRMLATGLTSLDWQHALTLRTIGAKRGRAARGRPGNR